MIEKRKTVDKKHDGNTKLRRHDYNHTLFMTKMAKVS